MAINPGSRQPEQIECRTCRENINKGAKLCHHCSSYQRAWKNWIPHIGAGIALVTFIASVMISGADILIRFIKDPNLEVVYLKWPTDLVVINNGGEKVLLEYLEIRGSEPDYYARKAINQTIERGEIAKIKLGGPSGGVLIKSRTTFPKVQTGESPVYFLRGAQEIKNAVSYNLEGTGVIAFRSTRDNRSNPQTFKLGGYMIQLPPLNNAKTP
jgi:hypothetical protein